MNRRRTKRKNGVVRRDVVHGGVPGRQISCSRAPSLPAHINSVRTSSSRPAPRSLPVYLSRNNWSTLSLALVALRLHVQRKLVNAASACSCSQLPRKTKEEWLDEQRRRALEDPASGLCSAWSVLPALSFIVRRSSLSTLPAFAHPPIFSPFFQSSSRADADTVAIQAATRNPILT
jgi:hypothetical protein